MKHTFFAIILLMATVSLRAQTVSNVQASFACPGEVTVTYDTDVPVVPDDAILYYSPDGGATWLEAQTVTRTDGTIVWDNKADNVSFGQFKLKVEVPQKEVECVEIAGVCWATRNVDAPGAFTANPEDAGMFYQWNRSFGWAATGTVSGWAASIPVATAWLKANDPCPTGYRVPTETEQTALVNSGSTWTSDYNGTGVAGRIFGSGTNTVFFPAAGYRLNSTGALISAGTSGLYWSSTQGGAYAYSVYFDSGLAYVSAGNRALGLSVRCVQE